MLLRLLSVLSISLSGIVLAAEAAPETLELMSFNVRFGMANDGENSWPHRRSILINTLKETEPTCFGVQECLDFQAEYIQEELPAYRWLGMGREKNGAGEMCAIFYQTKLLSPIAYGNFWLSETPEVPGSKSWDTACSRMATWAYFRHLKTDTYFYFFNVHLDHKSAAARKEGAALLAQRMWDIAEDKPVFLTGDFNAVGGDSAPWKALVDSELKDAWLEADKQQGPPVTWGGFTPPDPKDSRIDWILYRAPFKVLHCETVLYEEEGRYPSDHYPVRARFQLAP